MLQDFRTAVRSGTKALPAVWLAAAFICLFSAAFVAFLLIHPGPDSFVAEVDNLATIAGPLVLLPFAFGWFQRVWDKSVKVTSADQPRKRHYAATLLALGALTDTIGQTIWTFYAQVLHQATPFPSIADVSYLCTYPILLVGILLLPKGVSSATSRSRVTVDGLIFMTAAFTCGWFFVLGPTILAGGESLLAKLVGTAYPLGDLLLIGALVVLSMRARDAQFRAVIGLLVGGIASIVVADTVFDIQTLHNVYKTGEFIDVLWPLGDMLIALAAMSLRVTPRAQAGHAHTGQSTGTTASAVGQARRVVMASLPYALVPAVGILDLSLLFVRHDQQIAWGVVIGTAGLVLLVLVRQFLSVLENVQLSRQVERKNSELATANLRLEALATTDPLTDLINHRGLVGALENELERASRYHRPFTVLFMDIDHFKSINDNHGHSVGDSALHQFAQVATEVLRGVDVIGRWGGEEFLAILPETEADGASVVAERIRVAVAGTRFPEVAELRITCSIGVASYPRHAGDVDALVSAADDAMYAAKWLGRNQVRTCGDHAVPAAMAVRGDEPSRETDSTLATVEALASLVDVRDHYTGRHTSEVAALSRDIAVALGLDAESVRVVHLAARLHDIGKIAVPDAILLKPGRLTAEEWNLIKDHPGVGADVVREIPRLLPLAAIIRGHHERWSGGGYPDNLTGEDIPIGARIVSVADAFAAMTSDRPYRVCLSTQAALDELSRCSGGQFDPRVVAAFRSVLAQNKDLVA
ncbi:MAG TPA: diguanylate cyclase [Chloroflexota bacterium]|nr:diguanylate cyclase [Chloroflexota bacterium]